VAVLHYEGAENGNPSEDPSVNVSQSKLPLVETNLHVSYASLISESSSTRLTFSVQPLVPTPVVKFHSSVFFYCDP
jgi:hypothetical protein